MRLSVCVLWRLTSTSPLGAVCPGRRIGTDSSFQDLEAFGDRCRQVAAMEEPSRVRRLNHASDCPRQHGGHEGVTLKAEPIGEELCDYPLTLQLDPADHAFHDAR